MNLKEALDKPAKIKWRTRSSDQWLGTFEVGDQTYLLAFENDGDDEEDDWDIQFQIDDNDTKFSGSMGIIGTGGQFQVFATVALAMDEFIKKIKPWAFGFSSKEASRGRLYKRFGDMIVKKYPYSRDSFSNPRTHVFIRDE
jgi:hypothetical protein